MRLGDVLVFSVDVSIETAGRATTIDFRLDGSRKLARVPTGKPGSGHVVDSRVPHEVVEKAGEAIVAWCGAHPETVAQAWAG